ncbi:hypothetical protein H8958_017087 [Nasalis larvatus]
MIKRHLVLQQPGFLSTGCQTKCVLSASSHQPFLVMLRCPHLTYACRTFSPLHLMYTLKGALNFIRARNKGPSRVWGAGELGRRWRTFAPGPRGLLPAPLPDPARTGPAGKAAAARGRPGPAAGRRRARRSPSFPPFLLAQTRLGRTGPLVLCLLLLLHGAMRLGGGSREKLARGRAGRAARTGRGEGGRLAEEEAAGRRRRPGRTRGIPRAAGGLSRAGTRVLRYPSSHRRQ